MTSSRRRRFSARAAEDLLGGSSVPGHAHLAEVLRAAAAPGRSAELGGRERAGAEFHRGRSRTTQSPRRRPRFTSVALRLATVKAAAAAALFVGAGGVAVAASTGVLPTPLGGHSTPTTSVKHSASTHRSAPSPHPSAGSVPSTSLSGLCHAYRASNGATQGRSLDNPKFRPLVIAAGGKDHVDEYCAALLGVQSAHPKRGRSNHAGGHPSDHASHRTVHSSSVVSGRHMGSSAVHGAGHSKTRSH